MKIGRFLKLLLAIMIAIPFSSLVLIAGNQAQAATTDGAITVAQAIANNSGTGSVEGYIVGYANNSLSKSEFAAPFDGETNLLIADTPDERDTAKILPVQLPSNFRGEFGLVSNPDNLGKKIVVTGSLTAYFAQPGLKNPTAISFVDDTSTPSNPVSDTDSLTIAQVRALADNATATFTGVVTTTSGAFGGKSVYVQDDTGGIYLYQDSNDSVDDVDLAPGDKVTATGTKSTFSNEIELKVTDVQKIGTTSVPAPVVVTPTTANQYPGQLVTLSNVKVSDLADVGTYGSFSFNANSGSDKISVYVDDRTGLTKDVVKNDDTIDVTGIVAPNGSDFEIKPAGTDAITVVSDSGTGGNPPADPTTPLPDGAGKKVLFDNTHGETAGAADWVPDGGFSDFANGLKADGFTVAELDRPMPIDFSQPAITLDKLEQYDVFVLGEANIPFKASEQEAMKEYVEQGGSIFFIGDHYNSDRNLNRWDSGEVYNGFRRGAFDDPTKGMSTEEANSGAMKDVAASSDWLSDTFGVRFRGNAIGTVTSGETFAPEADSFGINNGVKSVEMHDGSTLAITDPTKAKGLVYLPNLTEADKSAYAVDQGVYNGGGVNEGPMAAIAKVGEGKAAFIGDSSPVEGGTTKYLREDTGKAKSDYPGFTSEGDDSTFLINLMNWLGEEEDYTSFQGKIKLDQPTPLLHTATVDETPSKTTEPEKEPWSDPIAGYKWYDPSTFAAGSYGSPKVVQSNPKFSFEHQETLPNEAPFQIRLDVTDLTAGQTLDNLQVGIYNPNSGAQIGKFKDSDGNWASGYGYSPKFSVTADTAGNAHIDLDVELDPSYTGDARLRLKSNGDAVVTENVTVGNVEVTPLDPYQVPVPDLSTISDARKAASGTSVTVDGVVTTKPGIWGGQGFYLQDATGGIYVYQTTSNYHLGQKVKLSGTVSPYNGELELSNLIDSHDGGDGTLPTPTIVKTVNDDNQGQLLKLQNVMVENLTNLNGTFEFDAVINGDTTTRVRVDSRSGFNYTDFTAKYKEGDKLDLTGIGSIFNGTYELKPRSADDITAASTGPVDVELLGINDWHGKIDQHYDLDIDGDGTIDGTYGGAEYLASYIRGIENNNPNAMLLGVGDIIGGSSPVSALFQDEPTVDITNSLNMQVNVVGNHEFDEGTTELLRMVNGGEYPGSNRPYSGMNNDELAANVVWKSDGDGHKAGDTILPAYSVKNIGGVNVGFIGVVTQSAADMVMPAGIQDINFTDPVSAINKSVKELQAQGVHAIVVLAHSAADQDTKGNITGEAATYAEKVDPDVDVIFAAHNHVVDNGEVNGKLIVEADEYGKAFSDVNLTIDPVTDDITAKSANVTWVDDSKVQPDPEVSNILKKYADEAGPLLNEVEGVAAHDMTGGYGVKGAKGDNAVGNLIADSMKAAMNSDFAMVNGGGIRDNLLAGDITYRDLYNILPFNNILEKLEIKGSDLTSIVNAQLSTYYGPDFSISGFKYTWDGNTGKVTSITLPDGSSIDPDKTYTITVNNFMATATAAKYAAIGKAGKNPVTGPEDLEALVSFVKSFENPIDYAPEGRISEVDGAAPIEPTPIPTDEPISVADVQAKADGTSVTVEGTVTITPGEFGSNMSFFLQDSTGTVNVYTYNNPGFKIGDKVKLTATKSTYNGAVELKDITASVVEGQSDLTPKIVTSITADLNNLLVSLNKVTVKNITEPDSYGSFSFDAVNGDNKTKVYVDDRTGITADSFAQKIKEGDVINVTGIASVSGTSIELKPRNLDDLVMATDDNTGNGGSTDNGNGNTDNGNGNTGDSGNIDNGNGNTDNGNGNTGDSGSTDNGDGNTGNSGSIDNGNGNTGNSGSIDKGNGNNGSPNKGGGSTGNSETIQSVTVTPGSETAVAVKAGETLKISGTNAQVILPTNLPAGTTVKVKKLDQQSSEVKMASDLEIAGDVYHFDFTYPNGKVFTGDFTLTLKYDADRYSADQVGIYYFNETTQKWELLNGTVDASKGTITVHVKHFSTYGVFAKKASSVSSSTSTSKGVTKGNSNSTLPVTSTPYPSYVLAGLLLALFGTMALIVRRRSNKKIKA